MVEGWAWAFLAWGEGCILANGGSGFLVLDQVPDCGGLHLEERESGKRGTISQEGAKHVLWVVKKMDSAGEEGH